ncbi:response regulator transcription factor [Paenarthrobacter sp. CAP02]|uniref:response regulator transcription factor n=1 Tax=Paenarthrobacter sp. CAP02 TaxID=3158144 RepID=UPI0032DAFD1C
MARILIADDEPRIVAFIGKGLRAAGHTTSSAGDGIQALDYGSSGEFDLLILDIGMPRMDGLSVLTALRDMKCTVPVIVLTARDSLPDALAALDGGADDYMSKPFRFEELLSRIRLRLRENPATQEAAAPASGDVRLDMDLRSAIVRGRSVQLTAREFAMAHVFLDHAGKLLSREQLLSRVWGYDFDGASNVVDVYVGYLRAKLGPEHFQSVRGAGYRFTPVEAGTEAATGSTPVDHG